MMPFTPEQLGRVARYGAGHPLILIHGFCGGGADWAPTMAALGRRFDVIAPDLPGFGRFASEPPCRSFGDMARHVVALADRLGIERFHVAGHSVGGFVVQQLLLDAPHRIARAVLYGAALTIDHAKRFESIPDTMERLQRDGVERTARRVVATWFLQGERHPCYESTAETGCRMSLPAALAAMEAVNGADYTGKLGGVETPCLVVLGERDRTFTPEMAVQLHRALPASSLCVIPGAAHAAHLERADLFNAVVGDFLLDTHK